MNINVEASLIAMGILSSFTHSVLEMYIRVSEYIWNLPSHPSKPWY